MSGLRDDSTGSRGAESKPDPLKKEDPPADKQPIKEPPPPPTEETPKIKEPPIEEPRVSTK
jgi:hypothetical protein